MPRQQTQEAKMKAALRQFEMRMTGHRTVPAPNPPAFVQLPWNSWTYQRTDRTQSQLERVLVTVGDITGQIKAQLGIDNPQENKGIRIKVQGAQVWCTASTLVLPRINCTFYELESGSNQPRSNQVDVGTLQNPAKCGYKFPNSDSKNVLITPFDSEQNVCDAIAESQDSDVTLRVQVLWQTDNTL